MFNNTKDLLNDAFNNIKQKNFINANKIFKKGLKYFPNNLDLLNHYFFFLYKIKDFKKALTIINKIIFIDNKSAVSFSNRSIIYLKMDEYQNALNDIDHCIFLNSKEDEYYNSKSIILNKMRNYKEALECLEKAIKLSPGKEIYYYNKGNTLSRLGFYQKAIAEYKNAIAININHYKSYYGLGVANEELNQQKEAMPYYETAIKIKQDYYPALMAKSRLLIRNGDFDQGWKLYEYRWAQEDKLSLPPGHNAPLWIGNQNLENKTILLQFEQGLGDTIQFCRYVVLFKQFSCKVILRVQKPLFGLMQASFYDDFIQVISEEKNIPQHDFYCPLMSLPLAFKTTTQTIPNRIPYLFTDRNTQQKWSKIFGEKKKIRIGLAWRGNPNHKNDLKRSFALEDVIDVLSDKFDWVSLQNNLKENEIQILNNNKFFLEYRDKINDFLDLAAICELVDKIITVDTSVLHLSGSLGKKTKLILPYYPDFRWMNDDFKSSWYPEVRIYKHDVDSSWKKILLKIQDDLIIDKK